MKNFWLSVTFCALFAACGSDSSSSSNNNNETEDNPSSSSSAPRENTNDAEDYIKSNTTYIMGTVKDNGSYINTVQFDTYIWTASNATYSGYSVESMCYDDTRSNCSSYGSLYMSNGASFACPSGYHVPSINEWKALDNFRKQSEEHETVLDLQYGGTCKENSKGEMLCYGLDTMARYLTSEKKYYLLKDGEKNSSFDDIDEYHAYYSLRCVAKTYIVNTKKNLPKCDTSSMDETYFVAEERSNYICTGSHWVDDFTDNCPSGSNGVVSKFNDTTYICKSGSWQLASISESIDQCTEENEGLLMRFNGRHYACKDLSWRIFSDIEDSLGYCNSKKLGTIDTLETDLRKTSYICDTTGWRRTTITDYIGECVASKQYKTDEYDSVGYVCTKKNGEFQWSTMSELEMDIGICSPKRMGEFDTTSVDSLFTPYYCDSTGWRSPTLKDYGGECTDVKEGIEINFKNYHYICKDESWTGLSGLEGYLGLCNEKKLGKVEVHGQNNYTYVCDTTGWRSRTDEEINNDCTKENMGKVVFFGKNEYYCSGAVWHLSSTKVNNRQCLITMNDEIDSTYEAYGRDTIYTYYRCLDSLGWFQQDAPSAHLPFCDSTTLGTFGLYNDTAYHCSAFAGWSMTSRANMEFGFCTSDMYGTRNTYKDSVYTCTATGWYADPHYKAFGSCTEDNEYEIKKSGDSTFYCVYYKWNSLSFPSSELGLCRTINKGETQKYQDITYLCDKGGWVLQDPEKHLGVCNEEYQKKKVKFNEQNYVCSNGSWIIDTQPNR